jgi:two-component system, cell cycle sensor histidine kinase and response regulator CckA
MKQGLLSGTDDALSATTGILTAPQALRQDVKILTALADPQAAERCISELTSAGFDLSADAVNSGHSLSKALKSNKYDAIIAQPDLPGSPGMNVLEMLQKQGLDVPLILVMNDLTTEEAGQLARRGVVSCLVGGNFTRLPFIMMRILKAKYLEEEIGWTNRARRLAEENYRSFFEQNVAGVFRVSLDGRILDLNESCAGIFGYATSDEARTHRLHDIVSSAEDIDYLLRRVQEKKILDNFEIELRRRDGQMLRVLASARLLEQDRDSPPLVGGTLVDVTRWRNAEEALRQRAHRFRVMLEKSSDAISLVDSTGKVLYSSHAVSPIFGYELDERVGKNVFELVHPEDAPQVLSTFSRLMQRPFTSVSAQLRYQHKDGSWRWIEALGTNLLEDPSVEGVVINYRDVTEQRRLQEQLFQAQKMEAIGALAGGVAHDFNNLLTAILGYSDMILEKAAPNSALHRYSTQIKQAGERAASLTRQLLAFSRLQVMAPKVLDLNAVISEMSRMLRRVIGEDIKLNVVAASGLGRVKVDPSQIEQVIINLAVNARDAMPQGGELTIRTANESIGESIAEDKIRLRPGAYVLLEVSDTGCGMDSETRARVFEPFFTTKEKGRGTGLGLSTVYGVVKQSGGYIWLSSELGKGASFKIYLPSVNEAISAAKTLEAPACDPGGAETILLVEDENAVRALLRRVLRSKGYRILEAERGEDALAICQTYQERIDLILTDIVMPKMSGQDLAHHASRLHPEAKLLYMTGYAGTKIGSAELLEMGAQFIQKPFSADTLTQKIRAVLDAPKQQPVHRDEHLTAMG